MIKLHGFPLTRTSRIQWLLEEAEQPYEYVLVNVQKGAHKAPEHVALHPHGAVPVLEDGALRLIESGAMCLHVADSARAAGKHLIGEPGSPERARTYQHVVYASSTLDELVIPAFFQLAFRKEADRDQALVDKLRKKFEAAVVFLEGELGEGPYLLGDAISVGDVAVGYDLQMAKTIGWLGDHPKLAAYTARLMERPAFQKAHPKRG